jgi:hypothetical protein
VIEVRAAEPERDIGEGHGARTLQRRPPRGDAGKHVRLSSFTVRGTSRETFGPPRVSSQYARRRHAQLVTAGARVP